MRIEKGLDQRLEMCVRVVLEKRLVMILEMGLRVEVEQSLLMKIWDKPWNYRGD